MQKRCFGRTGHMSSIVIFGAFALGKLSQDEADATMESVLESGVNHIDVAPSYHDAELRLGPWLERHRDQFFLGCKTLERTRDGARGELERSLKRLCTDRLDLYQLHAVTRLPELDECLAPGGAMQALLEARDRGLARYIGITSHGLQAPAVGLAALERYAFDSFLFPVNFVLWSNELYRKDASALLREAERRGVGIMAIKSIARGLWDGRTRRYNTWYEPFDDPVGVEQGLRFALSQPVTGAISAGDARLLPMILDAAERFRPMSEDEQDRLTARAKEYTSIF